MVYFGILDHFSRRTIRDSRVIGTLLGTEVGGVTEITNYFPVPHVESVDQVGRSVAITSRDTRLTGPLPCEGRGGYGLPPNHVRIAQTGQFKGGYCRLVRNRKRDHRVFRSDPRFLLAAVRPPSPPLLGY